MWWEGYKATNSNIFLNMFFSGTQQGKRDLEQLQPVTTEERMLFVLFTMLLINKVLKKLKIG